MNTNSLNSNNNLYGINGHNGIAELIGLKQRLILASQSPRRKFLLENLGLSFEIRPANIDEDKLPVGIPPNDVPKYLSQEKAKHIACRLSEDAEDADDVIIISADTIVALGDEILNKPTDEADAKRILLKLSGKTHTVFTGVTLMNTKTGKMLSNVQESLVTFRDLDEKEIDYYISTGSPMDKAGAYGIQDDFGAVFVSRVCGCYYNIVGLPLEMFYRMLREINEG